MNTLKEYEIGVMFYHIKEDPVDLKLIKLSVVQPIMFLLKMLSDAEIRYWPTELKIMTLVWALKKIRHMVEATDKLVIVHTDHAASMSIAYQTKLASTSSDKQNLQLVQASMYLS